MVQTGLDRKKSRIITVQTLQIILFVVSNVLLGGIPGAIVNVFCVIRNILCYYEKFGKKEKFLIVLFSTLISVLTNNLGIFGLLPIISNVIYTLFMDVKDMKKFKILVIVTEIMWLIYDISIKLYTSSVFDMFTIIASFLVLIQLLIGSKNKKEDKSIEKDEEKIKEN